MANINKRKPPELDAPTSAVGRIRTCAGYGCPLQEQIAANSTLRAVEIHLVAHIRAVLHQEDAMPGPGRLLIHTGAGLAERCGKKQ
jgi:hypothetical protein